MINQQYISRIKIDMHKAADSVSPLKEEINTKIFWLQKLLFDTNTFEDKLDIDYIKSVTDVLEINSDFQLKSTSSYITYYIPSASIVSEELSPTYFYRIDDKDQYLFRLYSNNTIDINHRMIWPIDKIKKKYSIKECMLFLLLQTTILKHLQLYNRYLLVHSRIHWFYNKPTDNVIELFVKKQLEKEDFINVIIFTANIIDIDVDLNLSAHANSIKSFHFLYQTNNKNRRELAISYNEKFKHSRSNLFKAIYNSISAGEAQKPIVNTWNTILFVQSYSDNGMCFPLRLVIVSKKDEERIKFFVVEHKYLYVVSKQEHYLWVDGETGNLLMDKKKIEELMRARPIDIKW